MGHPSQGAPWWTGLVVCQVSRDCLIDIRGPFVIRIADSFQALDNCACLAHDHDFRLGISHVVSLLSGERFRPKNPAVMLSCNAGPATHRTGMPKPSSTRRA